MRPGGRLGVVVPAFVSSVGDTPPTHLLEPQANGKRFWEDECWSFRTPSEWRTLFSRSGAVSDVAVDV